MQRFKAYASGKPARLAWLVALGAALTLGGCYENRLPSSKRISTADAGPDDGTGGDDAGESGNQGSGGGSNGGNAGEGGGANVNVTIEDGGAAGESSGGGGSGGVPADASAPDGAAPPTPRCIVRVRLGANVAVPDGLTWATAFDDPAEGAEMAGMLAGDDGCELRLSGGEFEVPDGLSLDNVTLRGGYRGIGGGADDRNPANWPTTLDGMGTADPVVEMQDSSLDGVRVRSGVLGVEVSGATGVTSRMDGVDVFGNMPAGGVAQSSGRLEMRRVRVFQNQRVGGAGGGGVRTSGASELLIEDAILANNAAMANASADGGQGGGLQFSSGMVTVRRTVFVGNTAAASGGGIGAGATGWRVEDSSFVGNRSMRGSAIASAASGVVVNATVAENRGGAAGAGHITWLNSILWRNDSSLGSFESGDATVLASIVEGGYNGSGSQDVVTNDPRFEGNRIDAERVTAAAVAMENPHTALSHTATVGAGVFESSFAFVGPAPSSVDGGVAPSSQPTAYFIVNNSTSSITLLGEVTGVIGDDVRVFDPRLASGSPAIDRGWGTTDDFTVSSADVEGNDRQDDPAAMNGLVGAPRFVDFGAYERTP